MASDVELEHIVKLAFFTRDLLSDTLGKYSGDALFQKLENAKVFWEYYGPGVSASPPTRLLLLEIH